MEKQTKQKLVVYGCLLVICGVAFLVRTVYPAQIVFGSGFVSFLETDAYNRMYYAKLIAEMPIGNAIAYTVQNSLLFSFTIAQISRLAPIELVGAWLPPVLAVLVVATVFLAGRSLFNTYIGLLAALFVALMPSEFLHRSLLGFTDHHVMEVLLLTLAIVLILKSMRAGRLLNKYAVLSGGTLVLYMLNWVSGFYLAIAVLLFTATVFFGHNILTKNKWHTSLLAVTLPLGIALLVYLPVGGYQKLLFLMPWINLPPVAVETSGEIVTTLLAPTSMRTISELMPLLYPFGELNFAVVITNLHLFAGTSLAGCIYAWKYRHDKRMLLLLAWTLVMLVITLNHRRFLYYLTINIALISAFAVYELAKMFKGNVYQNALILSLPLVIISMPLAKMVTIAQPFRMSPEWNQGLEWLKTQHGDGPVTAWGDYGHWIQYVSGKTPSYLPGPGGNLAARLFLSTDDAEAWDIVTTLQSDYVIVDRLTLERKYHALVVNAGGEPSEPTQGLAHRALYEGRTPPFLKLVYNSPSFKILKVTLASYYPPG